MNRDQYLSDPSVRDFIEWMKPKLCSPGSFSQSYEMPNKRVVTFNSIYDAFEQYQWRNADFNQTSKKLDCLAARLKAAANNPVAFRSACEDILSWGGVLADNQGLLQALGPEIVTAFKRAAAQLGPNAADCRKLGALKVQVPVAQRQRTAYLMSAGLTKVYSLMIPCFPMYDGRVGAALGLLSRMFCQAKGLGSVPANLAFPWGQGRSRIRDASRGTLRYVRFNGRPLLQAEWNLKAAWLLGKLCQHGCFGKLPENQRLRALEAALFMVGYDVS